MEKEAQLKVIETLMERLDTGVNVDAGGQVINPVSVYTDTGLMT